MDAKQILIVDDDTTMLASLRRYIRDTLGIEADIAQDTLTACRRVDNKKYSVIVSDYVMRYMDGLEFLVYVRSQGIQTPFICMSENSKDYMEDMCKDLTAFGYIEKPFHPREMLEMVKLALSHE